jgi:hypothetical protein
MHGSLIFRELFNLDMVVLGKFIDVVDSFDYVAFDEFLVFLPHAQKGSLYLAHHALKLSVYLRNLSVHPLILPLQCVAPLV